VILCNLIKSCNYTPSTSPIIPLLSDSVALFESGNLAARISAHSSSVNFLAASLNSFFLCSANRPALCLPHPGPIYWPAAMHSHRCPSTSKLLVDAIPADRYPPISESYPPYLSCPNSLPYVKTIRSLNPSPSIHC